MRKWLCRLRQRLFQDNGDQAEELRLLRQHNARLQEEHLQLSRLVHEYETKLIGLERRALEAESAKKRLEMGFIGLSKENQWMKDELLHRCDENRE